MKHMFLALMVSIVSAPPSLSQSLESSVVDDTALSRYQVFDEGQEILTLKELEVLQDQSKALFGEQKCEEAAEIGFADAANMSANILKRTLEPFYDANRDDQKIILNRYENKVLVSVERSFNKLLKDRNEAWFLEAKCYYVRGDTNTALTMLLRALNFIDGKDQSSKWVEAREMTWEIIGFNNVAD